MNINRSLYFGPRKTAPPSREARKGSGEERESPVAPQQASLVAARLAAATSRRVAPLVWLARRV